MPSAEAPPVVPLPQEKREEQAAPQEGQEEAAEANVTPKAHQPGSRARVEYRDQDGNLLDEEFVSQLAKEGKVQFETRHETQTRLEHAHEVDMVDGKVAPPAPPVAPPHPDVEGQDPETVGKEPPVVEDGPASAAGQGSPLGQEERSPEPKPAEEPNEATN